MSVFKNLDPRGPATLDAVVAAVARLSALDERQLLELVSSGDFEKSFPFHARRAVEPVPTFMDARQLAARKKASPAPMTRQERRELIQASMPASDEESQTLTNEELENELERAAHAHLHSNQS